MQKQRNNTSLEYPLFHMQFLHLHLHVYEKKELNFQKLAFLI